MCPFSNHPWLLLLNEQLRNLSAAQTCLFYSQFPCDRDARDCFLTAFLYLHWTTDRFNLSLLHLPRNATEGAVKLVIISPRLRLTSASAQIGKQKWKQTKRRNRHMPCRTIATGWTCPVGHQMHLQGCLLFYGPMEFVHVAFTVAATVSFWEFNLAKFARSFIAVRASAGSTNLWWTTETFMLCKMDVLL